MFGFGKKKYPIVTPEMFSRADQPITTTEAKRIYKQFLKDIGYAKQQGFDSSDLAEDARRLGEEITSERWTRSSWSGRSSRFSNTKSPINNSRCCSRVAV